ncbi:MAG TPA: hypothetical protein VGC76_17895 [Pyrinomonadaceae bacterium]|jgi:hypothetical protein
MKNFLFLGLFLLCCAGVCAQTPSPSPAPTPVKPSRAAQPIDQRGISNPGFVPDGLELRQMILQISVQPLYRKPTKQELKRVAPDSGLLQKFADFLRQENTGLFKFVADYGCAENPKIITATENCLKFTMPGAGNSYSFRTNNYRLRRLADLTFTGKFFYVSGVLTHGILVNVGDVPLENISLQTIGTKYLNEFQPAPDLEKAIELDRQLIDGVEKDGFLYSRASAVLENTTYVLRSIAYNGKSFRAVRGITYNELDFDKRKDITVAFRIIRRDGDGSVTILWKELSRKDSPKIKKRAIEANRQDKENKFVAKMR